MHVQIHAFRLAWSSRLPITPAKRPASVFSPRRKRMAQFPFQLNASSGSPIFQRWQPILTVSKTSQKWPAQICTFIISGRRPAITGRGATQLPFRLYQIPMNIAHHCLCKCFHPMMVAVVKKEPCSDNGDLRAAYCGDRRVFRQS
jgi:hypothetical protein